MECTHLFNFACTAVHLHHCTKWACAHLKPPLPVSLLLCAVASQNLSQNASRDVAWRFIHQHDYFCTALFLFTRPRSIFLEFLGIIKFGAFCWLRHCVAASHSPCSLPSCSLQKCHTCWLGTSLYWSFICTSSHSAHSRSISYSLEFKFQSCLLALLSCDDSLVMFLAIISISWGLEEGNARYTCPVFDSLLLVDVANGYLSVHPLSFCTSSCGDLLSRHGATVNSRFQPLPNLSGVIHLLLFFFPQFAPVWVRGFPSWFTLDKLIRRPQRDAYGDITYFAILVLYCLVLLNSFPGTCTGGNWYWYYTLITRRFLAKLPLARWSGGFLQSWQGQFLGQH